MHTGIDVSIWRIYIYIKICVYIYMHIYLWDIYELFFHIPRTEILGQRDYGELNAMEQWIPLSLPPLCSIDTQGYALESGMPCLPPWHTGLESCLVPNRHSHSDTVSLGEGRRNRQSSLSRLFPGIGNLLFSVWIVRTSFYYAGLFKTCSILQNIPWD